MHRRTLPGQMLAAGTMPLRLPACGRVEAPSTGQRWCNNEPAMEFFPEGEELQPLRG